MTTYIFYWSSFQPAIFIQCLAWSRLWSLSIQHFILWEQFVIPFSAFFLIVCAHTGYTKGQSELGKRQKRCIHLNCLKLLFLVVILSFHSNHLLSLKWQVNSSLTVKAFSFSSLVFVSTLASTFQIQLIPFSLSHPPPVLSPLPISLPTSLQSLELALLTAFWLQQFYINFVILSSIITDHSWLCRHYAYVCMYLVICISLVLLRSQKKNIWTRTAYYHLG